MNRDPDWALWRSFAAVVAEGSLSAAARQLGMSQPTIGRHVESLERNLGVRLFERTLTGLKPTQTALRLYEPVGAAQQALAEATMRAAGSQPEPDGTVRITGSTMICIYVLPTILKDIRARYPGIALEIVPSDTTENLLLREADIALRMFRPTQLELVTRKLGEIPLVCCAHESYLERRGAPQTLQDLTKHDVIGFDRSDLLIRTAATLGVDLPRSAFHLRSDSQPLCWQLACAGLGITFAQAQLVRATPGMRALLPGLAIPPLEMWLTTHRELFTSHRIRAIYDGLAAGLLDHMAQ